MNLRALSLDRTPPADYEPAGSLADNATLTEIADHYGTDKGTLKHNYTPIYDALLSKWRDKPIRLLEIGVACGASLKMWSRYFPEGLITGIDIRPECRALCSGYPNIEVVVADATRNRVNCRWPGESYRVIIDDGSHIAGHIVRAFNLYWPLLTPGGLYFIEDLRCTHNPNYSVPFEVDPADRDRGVLMNLIDSLLRRCDSGGDVASVKFYRELCVVEKNG